MPASVVDALAQDIVREGIECQAVLSAGVLLEQAFGARDRSISTCPVYRLERSRWCGGRYAWARINNFHLRRVRLYDSGLVAENSLFKNAEVFHRANSFKQCEFGTLFGTLSID